MEKKKTYRYRYNDQGFEVRVLEKEGFSVRVTHNISRDSVEVACADNKPQNTWVVKGLNSSILLADNMDAAVDKACEYILNQQKERWANGKREERNNIKRQIIELIEKL